MFAYTYTFTYGIVSVAAKWPFADIIYYNIDRDVQYKISTAISHLAIFTSDKIFSIREGWWYIGIKGDSGVKSK